jgi:hypothetical protein
MSVVCGVPRVAWSLFLSGISGATAVWDRGRWHTLFGLSPTVVTIPQLLKRNGPREA